MASKYPQSNLWKLSMLPYMAKDMIKMLRWEIILDNLGGPSVTTKILTKRTRESQGQREEVGWKQMAESSKDVVLLALRMEKGTVNQRKRVVSRSCKRQLGCFLKGCNVTQPRGPSLDF